MPDIDKPEVTEAGTIKNGERTAGGEDLCKRNTSEGSLTAEKMDLLKDAASDAVSG